MAWLIRELAGLGSTRIDLVGHDWGGGLVARLASTRPESVRSWVTDAAAIGDPDFEWHKLAKTYQTLGAGEAFFHHQLSLSVEQRRAVAKQLGVPDDGLR